jgi:MOSC domain-containing protein YiiM
MYRIGPYEFTRTDARRTFAALGELWRMYVHGLAEPPSAAFDHAEHMADRLVEATGHRPDPPVAPDDVASTLTVLGAAAEQCVTTGDWDDRRTTEELAAAWTGVRAVGDELRAAGLVATSGTGAVARVNTSMGGVPKVPLESADVGWSGVAGDVQAARQHHGRPWQALCLWGVEVIDRFAADGHPIGPGSAGENLTLSGLAWSQIRPGSRLRIGSVECEVSSYAIPCSKNARWFSDGTYQRMHHTAGPVSRVYATVLQPGYIVTGDAVTLLA